MFPREVLNLLANVGSVAFLLAALLMLLNAGHAQDLESWRFVNPQPVADPVFSIAWDGNRFVGWPLNDKAKRAGSYW